MRKSIVILLVILMATSCTNSTNYKDDFIENLNYLKLTLKYSRIDEFSMKELIESVLDGAKDVGVTGLNVAISEDGLVDSLVLSISDEFSSEEITYMYRRDEDISKCYSISNNNDSISRSADLSILDMLDNSVKSVTQEVKEGELMIFDLMAPTVIGITAEAGDIVNGREISSETEVNGYIFHCYVSPVESSSYSVLVVETN